MILKNVGFWLITLLLLVNQGVNGQSCNVDGGVISTSSSTVVCSGDDRPDIINVSLNNNFGEISEWLITDANQIIIQVSEVSEFNFDGYEEAVILIYHVSHDGSVVFEEGLNTNDIMGCFDLSNPISIVTEEVDGGVIFDDRNTTVRTICVGDGIPNNILLTREGMIGQTNTWVITDHDGNIIDLPVAPPFDFEGADPGICFVYNLAYNNIAGLTVGTHITELTGCYDLSNPYQVSRLSGDVNGGSISSNSPISFCSGDGSPDIINLQLAGFEGDNSSYIITDVSGNILEVSSTSSFNVEGRTETEIVIWHIAYVDGLRNLAPGRNLTDLQGCFNFSNSINISLEVVSGGSISNLNGPLELFFCTNDGLPDMVAVSREGAIGGTKIFVITQDDGEILDITNNNAFNFEGIEGGVCNIYNISFNDVPSGFDIGLDINAMTGCYSLSNPITVHRISGVTNPLSISTDDNTTLCTGDPFPDIVNVALSGSPLSIGTWIITDADSVILELPIAPPFDFSDAPSGVCKIFYIDYVQGTTGISPGEKLTNIKGCFDLSNEIIINRNGVNGGDLSLLNGDTTTLICVGNSGLNILPLSLTGSSGSNSKWVVTEDADSIVLVVDNNDFDFNTLGPGTCYFQHIAFEDGLTGLDIGSRLGNLIGCFSLSNAIEIVKQEGVTFPGSIFTSDNTEVCGGDGSSNNILFEELPGVGSISNWIVTDNGGVILKIQISRTIDFDELPGGICRVRNIRYEEGILGLEVGELITDLQGCFSLSNSIVINKEEVNGGSLRLFPSGEISTTICLGSGDNSVQLNVENKKGELFSFILTDGAGNIIDLKLTPEFNFSDAFLFAYNIWHIGYQSGIQGLEIGGNINQLDGCYDISNPVTINFQEVDGGTIETVDGFTSLNLCTGEGINDLVEVQLENVAGRKRTWVLTDNIGNILELPTGPVFNFESAPSGTCFIYNLSYHDQLTNLAVGQNISDLEGCHDFSNGIRINKSSVQGGDLTIVGSNDFISICAGDNKADTIEFNLTNDSGGASQFIIVNENGQIQEIFDELKKDFNEYDNGLCRILAVSYFNIEGLNVGNSINNLSGCYALSNEVIVKKQRPRGGILTNDMNENNQTICIGEGIPDLINVRVVNAVGDDFRWFITDESGTILENNRTPPFNLENAGAGICKIYHVRYVDNLSGTAKGLNINNLEGCFSLSNALTITRQSVREGIIMTADTTLEKTICVDDDFIFDIDIIVQEQEGENQVWVITDTTKMILATQSEPSFGLDNAGEGVCLIYHVSFNGSIENLEISKSLDSLVGCFRISNSVRINRLSGEACTTSIIEIDGSSYTLDIYPNPAFYTIYIKSDIPSDQILNAGIYSLNGQLLKSFSNNEIKSPIDIADLAPGIYLFTVTTKSTTGLVKFVKH
jgi:hypothetical protein